MRSSILIANKLDFTFCKIYPTHAVVTKFRCRGNWNYKRFSRPQLMSQFAQINTKLSIKQKFKNTRDSLTIHSCKIHKTED